MASSELPTERTPLISSQNGTQLRPQKLPSITRLEQELYSQLPTSSSIAQPIVDLVDASSLPSETAKNALFLLLCLRYLNGSWYEGHKEVPRSKQSQAVEVEEYIVNLWQKFINEDSEADLDALLWLSFPLKDEHPETMTAIQAALEPGRPATISSDGFIAESMLRVWKRGRPMILEDRDGTLFGSVAHRLRRIATPRVMHLTELALFLGYLGVFADYSLNPPWHSIFEEPPRPDWRSVILVIYAASRCAGGSQRRAAPFYFTFFAFLVALPSVPGPNDSSYVLLLFAFSLHLIQLHLPSAPSPVLLFPNARALPISGILQTLVSSIFIPVFLFFLPAFLLATFLMSLSVSDIFLRFNVAFSSTMDPSPVNARVAFMLLFLVIIILFSCVVTSVILLSPGLAPTANRRLSWDSYGKEVGLRTRQYFVSATIHYSEPYFFPAPLNLLHLVLVAIPVKITTFFGARRLATRDKETTEPLLWTLFVLPLALVVGSAWAWGLLNN